MQPMAPAFLTPFRVCLTILIQAVIGFGLGADYMLIPLMAAAQSHTGYPVHWWAAVPESQRASWEILPQAAKPGEVILSKRNELGILSNFSATPFTLIPWGASSTAAEIVSWRRPPLVRS